MQGMQKFAARMAASGHASRPKVTGRLSAVSKPQKDIQRKILGSRKNSITTANRMSIVPIHFKIITLTETGILNPIGLDRL